MTNPKPDQGISASAMRQDFTVHLRRAMSGERVMVTLYNQPVAALVPIRDYLAYAPPPPSSISPETHRAFKSPGQTTGRHREEHTMNVIVSANLSGGEGKSTCAREFAYVIASQGYRVGIIDLDPQASLTKSLGLHDDLEGENPRPAMTIRATAFDAITSPEGNLPEPISVHGVDIWPSNKHVSKLEGMLYSNSEDMRNLRMAIRRLQNYDFIFIDTTPVRTMLMLNAVAAADDVVVPVSEFKGLENLPNLLEVLDSVRGISPDIGIRMFAPNRQKSRQKFYQEIQAELQGTRDHVAVSPAIEDRASPVNAALVARMPVVLHSPRSEAAREFTIAGMTLLNALRPDRDTTVVSKPKTGITVIPEGQTEVSTGHVR